MHEQVRRTTELLIEDPDPLSGLAVQHVAVHDTPTVRDDRVLDHAHAAVAETPLEPEVRRADGVAHACSDHVAEHVRVARVGDLEAERTLDQLLEGLEPCGIAVTRTHVPIPGDAQSGHLVTDGVQILHCRFSLQAAPSFCAQGNS